MSALSLKRISKELSELQKHPVEGCSAKPVDTENIFKWRAVIVGPSETPYSGGVFHLDVMFPEDYPISPPSMKFSTKIYHCNVNDEGAICLDILKENWSPSLTLSKILLSICSLLGDPNPDDPLVPEIANLYVKDRKKHDENAKKWTDKYAM